MVGADGRNSTVRKQVGITLERQEPISYISGLLLDGLDGVPDDFDALASEGDSWFLIFHQRRGRARRTSARVSPASIASRVPTGRRRFLEACGAELVIRGARRSRARRRPARAPRTPGDDTWTREPYVDGVVLIGDAAGHNDPIVGQGLSIAMRDARTVRDLVLDGARDAAAFASYGAERMERMRRLRLIADCDRGNPGRGCRQPQGSEAVFGEKMAAMDPGFFPLLIGAFAGPETVPAELVDESVCSTRFGRSDQDLRQRRRKLTRGCRFRKLPFVAVVRGRTGRLP